MEEEKKKDPICKEFEKSFVHVLPCLDKMKTKYMICGCFILIVIFVGNCFFVHRKLSDDEKKKEERPGAVITATIFSSFFIVILSFLFLILFKLTPLASLIIKFVSGCIRIYKTVKNGFINLVLKCEGEEPEALKHMSDTDKKAFKKEVKKLAKKDAKNYWNLFTKLNEQIFDIQIFDIPILKPFKRHNKLGYKIGALFLLIALTNIPTVITWSTSLYEYYHIFWGIMLLVILVNVAILILYLLPIIMLFMSYNKPLYKLITDNASNEGISKILNCYEAETKPVG